jgi:hypothetical protein
LITEHMRMAAQQLFGDRLDHAAKVERALLLRHAGVERDLEQEVAKLFTQVVEIVAGDGVRDFIGLFKRIGRDGREVLLEVPRAAGAGRAQRRHDFQEPGNVARRFHGRCLVSMGWGYLSPYPGNRIEVGAPVGLHCESTKNIREVSHVQCQATGPFYFSDRRRVACLQRADRGRGLVADLRDQ